MTSYLTTEDLLGLIADLAVGPIRDLGLLDAAAHRPQATVFGTDAYPSIDAKAAALLESLLRNHCLVDGNKRLGWLALVVFYGLNQVSLDVDDDEAYRLVMGLAAGELTGDQLVNTLRNWRLD